MYFFFSNTLPFNNRYPVTSADDYSASGYHACYLANGFLICVHRYRWTHIGPGIFSTLPVPRSSVIFSAARDCRFPCESVQARTGGVWAGEYLRAITRADGVFHFTFFFNLGFFPPIPLASSRDKLSGRRHGVGGDCVLFCVCGSVQRGDTQG